MKQSDSSVPPRGGGTFAVRTIRALGAALGRIRFLEGKETGGRIPVLLRLLVLFLAILSLSLTRSRLVLLALTAAPLLILAFRPPGEILSVLRAPLAGAGLTGLLMVPAMVLSPAGPFHALVLVWKVFLSLLLVSMFGHRTQWNQVTRALKRLHIPGIFIFTVDITLKYIVVLGRFVSGLLTACLLRGLGNRKGNYKTAGGVMGVTFIRGTELSREMYDAMRCRGFTDDYGETEDT